MSLAAGIERRFATGHPQRPGRIRAAGDAGLKTLAHARAALGL